MRIISGIHKGRRLIAPKNLPVRPTTDRAKEALFNILFNRYNFNDIKVLDLFSGTGNIAFEFASRGTKHVTAVDIHKNCTWFIGKTARELELEITSIKSDVFKYLENNPLDTEIIFADPPYKFEQKEFEKIISLCKENYDSEKEGLLIVEHSDKTDLSNSPGFEEYRNYGSSSFSFFAL